MWDPPKGEQKTSDGDATCIVGFISRNQESSIYGSSSSDVIRKKYHNPKKREEKQYQDKNWRRGPLALRQLSLALTSMRHTANGAHDTSAVPGSKVLQNAAKKGYWLRSNSTLPFEKKGTQLASKRDIGAFPVNSYQKTGKKLFQKLSSLMFLCDGTARKGLMSACFKHENLCGVRVLFQPKHQRKVDGIQLLVKSWRSFIKRNVYLTLIWTVIFTSSGQQFYPRGMDEFSPYEDVPSIWEFCDGLENRAWHIIKSCCDL